MGFFLKRVLIAVGLFIDAGQSQCIHSHLLDHGEQTIGTRGTEVLCEPYLTNEIEVGIQNFLGLMSTHHTEQEADDATHDEGITLCSEIDSAICTSVAHKPHTALTTVDEVLFCLLFRGQGCLLLAHVDEELVAIHPVVKATELLDYFVLYIVDTHFVYIIKASVVCIG